MSLKTFSLTSAEVVPGGTSLVRDFNLVNVNREMKIKSISWDFLTQDDVTGKIIPFELLTDSRIALIIGDANKKLCEAFTPVLPFAPLYNGGVFYLLRPQQVIFNSFFLTSDLPLRILIDNFITAGAVQINVISTLVIETEQKILY